MKTFKQYVEAAEFGKRLKLFGAAAARVTTAEMQQVFDELKPIFKNDFLKMGLTKSLATKPDHGDIDILVLTQPNVNLENIVRLRLGERVKQFKSNGNIHSFLYDSPAIYKSVHVDFILSTNQDHHDTREQYYQFNDFAPVIGIISKKLHFKYGTEGFFKRFEDKKGVWHDVLITSNLNDGLRILGYKDVENKLEGIKSPDDIAKFVVGSPLVGINLFESLNTMERQSTNRRTTMDYILDKIRELNIQQQITDEDYFFKKLYPDAYQKVETKKQEINDRSYIKSGKYNGSWVMDNFHLRPGPEIGKILKSLELQFGANLENTPEDTVKQYIINSRK